MKMNVSILIIKTYGSYKELGGECSREFLSWVVLEKTLNNSDDNIHYYYLSIGQKIIVSDAIFVGKRIIIHFTFFHLLYSLCLLPTLWFKIGTYIATIIYYLDTLAKPD